MAVKLKGLPPSSFPPWEKNIPSLGRKCSQPRKWHVSFDKGRVLDDKGWLLNDKERLSQDLTWFSRKVPMSYKKTAFYTNLFLNQRPKTGSVRCNCCISE